MKGEGIAGFVIVTSWIYPW